jgi:hypothetical protein
MGWYYAKKGRTARCMKLLLCAGSVEWSDHIGYAAFPCKFCKRLFSRLESVTSGHKAAALPQRQGSNDLDLVPIIQKKLKN